MPRRSLRFLRKDRTVELSAFSPSTTLLDYLRLTEKSCGTKEGCAEGDCGACTVVLARASEGRIRYDPVNACILLLGQVDGAQVITIEDLANSGKLHPVQQAMLTHHGSQCGFCTPGIVMSLFALYHEAARPVATATVNDALAGNLCRCTGYRPIRDAAAEACANAPSDQFQASEAATQRALDALTAEDQDIIRRRRSKLLRKPGLDRDARGALSRPSRRHARLGRHGCRPLDHQAAGRTEEDHLAWQGRRVFRHSRGRRPARARGRRHAYGGAAGARPHPR